MGGDPTPWQQWPVGDPVERLEAECRRRAITNRPGDVEDAGRTVAQLEEDVELVMFSALSPVQRETAATLWWIDGMALKPALKAARHL